MCCVLDLLFAFLYSLFFILGSPFKFNLLLQSLAPYNDFVFPQLVFEPCYILLEDGTHSSHSRGHNTRHRQSFQTIAFVMMNCCCKYKLLEISRLLNYADMSTIELFRTFDQVTQLLRNTTKIVLLKASGMFQNTLWMYKRTKSCSGGSSCCCRQWPTLEKALPWERATVGDS